MAGNPLAARLRELIEREGPISFAAFMHAALYDEQHGFYARGAAIGRRGAFTTAPIAVPFFADALARELRQCWDRLGRPEPFTVCEVGPGDGTLAARLAERLADLPLELVLCDRAAGMLAQASARVPTARVATLGELAPVVGAIVANEVHDACPTHRLRWPSELFVAVGEDRRFRLVEGERGAGLAEPILASGAVPADGREYEVSPAQAELQAQLARALGRGSLLVFDYGEAGPQRYLRRVPRLRTYLAGSFGGDPLSAPGTQDITVDVDFGAVRLAGEAAGLRTELDCGQPAWLRSHGAERALAALDPVAGEAAWLRSLIDEASTFRVLRQDRGPSD